MHWREKADIFCGFTLLPSDNMQAKKNHLQYFSMKLFCFNE